MYESYCKKKKKLHAKYLWAISVVPLGYDLIFLQVIFREFLFNIMFLEERIKKGQI